MAAPYFYLIQDHLVYPHFVEGFGISLPLIRQVDVAPKIGQVKSEGSPGRAHMGEEDRCCRGMWTNIIRCRETKGEYFCYDFARDPIHGITCRLLYTKISSRLDGPSGINFKAGIYGLQERLNFVKATKFRSFHPLASMESHRSPSS